LPPEASSALLQRRRMWHDLFPVAASTSNISRCHRQCVNAIRSASKGVGSKQRGRKPILRLTPPGRPSTQESVNRFPTLFVRPFFLRSQPHLATASPCCSEDRRVPATVLIAERGLLGEGDLLPACRAASLKPQRSCRAGDILSAKRKFFINNTLHNYYCQYVATGRDSFGGRPWGRAGRGSGAREAKGAGMRRIVHDGKPRTPSS
jgi:hypothetical protein